MARHNEDELLTVVAATESRRPYSTPTLSALGSFAKLTRDAAKANYNDRSGMEAMPPM